MSAKRMSLNAQQKQAVVVLGGPALLLAGPGSGKTETMTRRVQYLFEEKQVNPGRILVVTFTNKAALEMEQRIASLVGADVASELWLGTFHSLCARILRKYGPKLGFKADFEILGTGDQEKVIKALMNKSGGEKWLFKPVEAVKRIGSLKDDGVLPEQALKVAVSEEERSLARLYGSYQKTLLKMNSMDFADLLLQCMVLWKKWPLCLEMYSKQFHHVIVDEYQDTNGTQLLWLKALAGHHNNIWVVGDDDQLIYGWRGAKLDNTLHFTQHFPGAQVIQLERNYRCSSNITRVAKALISHNDSRIDKTIKCRKADSPLVTLYDAKTCHDEAKFVVDRIVKHYGQQLNDVAILVRAKQLIPTIERTLVGHEIPYQVVKGNRFVDQKEIKDAVAYLRLAIHPGNDQAFERVLNVPKRGLGDAALTKIQKQAEQDGQSLFRAARKIVRNKSIRSWEKLGEFLSIIKSAWQMVKDGQEPREVYDHLLGESKLHHGIEEKQLENLKWMGASISGYDDLIEFLQVIALSTDDEVQEERVTISTMHAAKGREFSTVFLVGLEEGILPDSRAKDKKGGLDEERRVTYVAITRAKRNLYLTWAEKRRQYGLYSATKRSRFIKEISTKCPQSIDQYSWKQNQNDRSESDS